MPLTFALMIIAMVLYSGAILYLEGVSGQDAARWYLTDIDAAGAFYGVNTSLTAWSLIASATVYFLTARQLALLGANSRNQLFFNLQGSLFLFLAIDERFRVHEYLGIFLVRNDAWIILALGIFEMAVLVIWRQLWTRSRRATILLVASACFFMIMVAIDGMVPSAMRFRLSVEDLSKFWGAVLLFGFSLEVSRLQTWEQRLHLGTRNPEVSRL